MRVTSLLTTLLGLKQTRVVGVEFCELGLIVDVRPTTRVPRCSACKRKVRAGYDHADGRMWRHLDLAGMRFWLRYDSRRVSCPHCGVRVEWVPWAEASAWFTREFEDHVAYLVQRTDKSTVKRLMRVGWDTIGTIISRVVARHGRDDRLEGLRCIGIDELSYRRHHEYVTVVVDHDRAEVVWVGEGKSSETLARFFAELGPEACAELEAVTIDMSGAYIKAVTKASPEAQIIFDRFHVQRLAHDAVDEVRRQQVREAEDDDAKKVLKSTRWPLLKNPWNLTFFERRKLSELQRYNQPIYRAYLLKEALIAVLDRRQVNVARRKLEEWLAWVSRSRLKPFIKLGRTIRRHMEGILAYVRSGLSNGRTEGLNGKARVLTRRAYGFHSAGSLASLLLLCCSDIHLGPVRNDPHSTH